MPKNIYFLMVGVNNGGRDQANLGAAERDAAELSRAFADLGYQSSETHRLLMGGEVTRENLGRELRQFGAARDGDLLVVYWAGHAAKRMVDGEVHLYLSETGAQDEYEKMLSLRELVAALRGSAGFRTHVLVLDTCYSGSALDLVHALSGPEEICALTACGATQLAREDPSRHGFATQALLDNLKAARSQNQTKLDLGSLFDTVAEDLKGTSQDAQSYKRGTKIVLPVRLKSEVRPVRKPSTDPLEEALGHVIQAFRSYLDENVVRNVELIYFLGYDIWDGCLVYDGLVQGGVEQQLLNFIRNRFLRRDRLRSRYEELMAEGPQEDLGMAGRCFGAAIETMKNESENPALRGLLYIGDLRRYKSEYRHFDRLLGLRSCLYIPVVETVFPSSGTEAAEPAKERRPLGGVLMAANRRPYGLFPVLPTLSEESWRRDRGDDTAEAGPGEGLTEPDAIDRGISESIRMNLTEVVEEFDATGQVSAREYFRHNQMRSLLNSIGGVYQQRAVRRAGLRKGLHPRFLKTAKREIGENQIGARTIDRRKELIEEISRKVERARSPDPFALADEVSRFRGGNFLPEDRALQSEGQLLAQDYAIATVWRDLKIEGRLLENKKFERSGEDEEKLSRIRIRLKSPWAAGEGASLRDYITERQTFLRIEQLDVLPEPGDNRLWELCIGLIDDLLDDVREARKSPFEIAYGAVQELAPVQRYIDAISHLEGTFGGVTQQKMFNDLAHSLLIWTLGLWILSTPIRQTKDGAAVESVRHRFASYVKAKGQLRHHLQSGWLGQLRSDQLEDHLVLFWGLIAATHDIAIPVQRFEKNFRWFFNEYFGQESLPEREGSLFAVMMDILDHPRFPIYKNAITSLYRNRERDWVEAIFHHALAKNVLHSTVGALILIRELEPNGKRSSDAPRALWQAVRPALEDIGREHEKTNPELGLLIPAYLAHAVTFSQLPDFQALWGKLTAGWKDESHLQYLRKPADGFRVRLEEYPLSYLLGLLEAVLEPIYDEELPDYLLAKTLRERKGYSPFYVSDVGVDPKTAGEGKLVLRLAVRFWGDSLEDEKVTYASDYIEDLYKDSSDDPQIYALKLENLRKKDRRRYEIVRLLDRLRAFERSFESQEWCVKVRFDNVSLPLAGKLFTYPDNMP